MYMTYVTWYRPGILPNAAVKPKYRESACQTFTHGFYSYTGGICGIVHVYVDARLVMFPWFVQPYSQE